MKLKSRAIIFVSGLVVALVAIITTLSFSNPFGSKEKPKTSEEKPVPVVINRKFGVAVDSFQMVSSKIQRNEFLATILQKYHIHPKKIAALASKSKTVFDIRDIRAGKPYTVFCSKDSLQKARYFVYQPNPIDYIVYDLRDSVRIYKGKRKVTTTTKKVAGVINHSLFEALDEVQADPELAMKLANIYAWDIDFYRIDKGDWFKIIYDQQYVGVTPVGIGRIKSAVFNHGGQKFYAFYFHDDSTNTDGYYDEKAKSLRKAFLKAPLKFYHITSHYSRHRFHPIQHRWKAHLGTDYAAPTGTPIMSTAAGTVIASRYSRFNGNYVKIRHNATYTTQYLHMSKRAVHVGEHVKQGQVIGYVGSTGLATGPHVCYRFWKNGKQVDPFKQHFPPAKPIAESDLVAFRTLVQQEKGKLDQMQMTGL